MSGSLSSMDGKDEESKGPTTSGEIGGVSGKTVKVSIMPHLQGFRRDNTRVQAPRVRNESKVQKFTALSFTANSKTDSEELDKGGPSSQIKSDVHGSENVEIEIHERESPTIVFDEDIIGHEITPTDEQDIEGKGCNVIRPINRTVVHQICSGQVIVTLSTAVKELVENSLDAGASKIDIRLVEYGSKLIEVSDNACGIEETNFEGLALKHHTSKITEFEDLGSLSTFGFRGEALSSLCALSNMTVITRHKDNDQKIGHKLEYDNRGRISSKGKCAREHGTTISLKDLFYTLPVRHREFLKNLKREFHRMINILYGYCLVVNGVRITCTNQVGHGAPTKVLAVPSCPLMKDRIVSLFGSKQFASLIEIKQQEEVPEEILSEYGLNNQSYERKYELEGYISRPNQGRSSNDRQFYFINSRPCDPAKISRVVNEVYHTFSRHQNPFICLHIRTNRENVDINVTPDKRTLYVQNEKILLASIKASLLPLLMSAASTFEASSSLSQTQLTFSGHSQSESDNAILESNSSSIKIDYIETPVEELSEGFARQYSSAGRSSVSRSVVEKTNIFLNRFRAGVSGGTFKRPRDYCCSLKKGSLKQAKLSSDFLSLHNSKLGESNKSQEDSEAYEEIPQFQASKAIESCEGLSSSNSSYMETDNETEEDEIIVYDDDIEYFGEDPPRNIKIVSVAVNWKDISNFASKVHGDDASSTVNYSRRFRAKIAPEDNNAAEVELQKQLSKDMFSQMDILGQFNLGFIIVKNGPDLFIVDQHASDEKYNFEDLEKRTVLQSQPLICPLDLELPAISENIVIDNITVFQKNGFDFIISPHEEPTKRLQLSQVPTSKNTEFDKSDVEELVFMMEGATEDSFYRPTKVRQMLASRACRKSVMIGTALNPKEMRKIVDHMGEMEQPWNCPHGRPTIRHLINLNLLPDLNDITFNH